MDPKPDFQDRKAGHAAALAEAIGIDRHRPLVDGVFRSRPNRFIARCTVYGRDIDVFMPNPGRMGEILLPATPLILMDHGESDTRRTRYTVMAAYVKDRVVFLHTHKSNHVARFLIDNQRIAALRDCRVARAEVPHGRSRFDFLLDGPDGPLFLEVKSCTLVARGVAMFPDAVTERGRRHMVELADMHAKGIRTAILFLIHNSSARYFLPDYHTDIRFSETFKEMEQALPIYAVSIGWRSDLTIDDHAATVTIPWDVIRREVVDKGHVLALGRQGHLFTISLTAYGDGLSDRLRNDATAAKKKGTYSVKNIFPVRSSIDLTSTMLDALETLYGSAQEGKSDDGDLNTYTFQMEEDPARQPAFQDLILDFRMPASLTARHP